MGNRGRATRGGAGRWRSRSVRSPASGRRASRPPLLGDRPQHRADDVAGPASWIGRNSASLEGRARRRPHPHAQRRDRRRGRQRSRSVPARDDVPVVSAANVDELPPITPSNDDPERREQFLLDAVPKDSRKVYKMRPIIEAVVDRGSFFEIGRAWGESIITGLARLAGLPVAVLAEDPFVYGGAWTADAAQAHAPHGLGRDLPPAARASGRLPRVLDRQAVRGGRDDPPRARRRSPRSVRPVPFVSVIVRKAFGVAGAANHKPGRHHVPLRVAIRRLGLAADRRRHRGRVQGGTRAADDPDALRAAIKERLNRVRSPFRSAE